MSDIFEKFGKKLNVKHIASSSYQYQSNDPVEACIKFIMQKLKNCSSNTTSDTHLVLLQIRTMPLGPGLPSLVTLLFNCPMNGIMPIVNRLPNSLNNDDEHCKALAKRKNTK